MSSYDEVNDSNESESANTESQCPKCKTIVDQQQEFCNNCGTSLKGKANRTSGPLLGGMIKDHQTKQIKHARYAILAVGILTILFTIFTHYELISRHRSNSGQALAAILISYALGIGFFGLFVWARKNPYAASLTALIIYITNIIIAAGMDPRSLPSGLIVKIIIIAALVNGVKSGLDYNREQQSGREIG